jgi:hypothetical protein
VFRLDLLHVFLFSPTSREDLLMVDGNLGIGLGGVTCAFRGESIQQFAQLHFKASKYFAARVRKIEIENTGRKLGDLWDQIVI